jgi:hypothetical protein
MPVAALIVIVIVALLAVAGAAAWFLGYPVTGLESVRAATAEAGERVSDLTADFIDWVKLGS